MKIFVDSMGNIHDVEVTTDESLIELEINDDKIPSQNGQLIKFAVTESR